MNVRMILIVLTALLVAGYSCVSFLGLNAPSKLVAEARIGPIRSSVTGNLQVHAESIFEIRSTSQAFIEWVALMPLGKPIEVEANQTLLKLETDDLDDQLNLLQLEERQLLERNSLGSLTEIDLEVRKKDLDAMRELVDFEHEPVFDLQRKSSEVSRLSTSVQLEQMNHRHQLERIAWERRNLMRKREDRSISTPIDGVFSECFVSPGNMLFPGSLAGRVLSHQKIMEVSVNEEDFKDLKEGLPAFVSMFSMGNKKVLEGKVSSLSASVDPKSGTRKAYLSLQSDLDLPAGSSGRAELIKYEKNAALIIPAKALLGETVMVEKNGKVRMRKVLTGARNFRTVEVLEGLEEGERVVVETPQTLQDDDSIIPVLVSFED